MKGRLNELCVAALQEENHEKKRLSRGFQLVLVHGLFWL
jgi:hypothetical protein